VQAKAKCEVEEKNKTFTTGEVEKLVNEGTDRVKNDFCIFYRSTKGLLK
jgi:hypothetical protein